jgi:hypothetical protein
MLQVRPLTMIYVSLVASWVGGMWQVAGGRTLGLPVWEVQPNLYVNNAVIVIDLDILSTRMEQFSQ